MKTLLQIHSSIQDKGAQSSLLANKMSDKLLSGIRGANHIKRDISDGSMPHLTQDTLCTFFDPSAAVTATQKIELDRSNTLITELKQADVLLLTAPMYNNMIPSTLKSWIDYVSRANITFKYTENGRIGLLKNKKAFVIITQGGKCLSTSTNHIAEYLTLALEFMGINDISFIYAQGLAMGKQEAELGLNAALQQIEELTNELIDDSQNNTTCKP